jgi:hypothetical protein
VFDGEELVGGAYPFCAVALAIDEALWVEVEPVVEVVLVVNPLGV